jgi:hypothetical protein
MTTRAPSFLPFFADCEIEKLEVFTNFFGNLFNQGVEFSYEKNSRSVFGKLPKDDLDSISIIQSDLKTGLVASVVVNIEDGITYRYVVLTYHLTSTGETIVVAYAKIHKGFDLQKIVEILHEEFVFQGKTLEECLELVQTN